MTEPSPRQADVKNPERVVAVEAQAQPSEGTAEPNMEEQSNRIRIRNRRKTYLDRNPDYFSSDLELADPLLYDRLIRKFQTAAEREVEGRSRGFSGVLEADMLRSEAKISALANDNATQPLAYPKAADGSILAEDPSDSAATKEEGEARWRKLMEWRFLRGDDEQFDYRQIDENEEYDDEDEQRREAEDKYFDNEEPSWVILDDATGEKPELTGETGVQDF